MALQGARFTPAAKLRGRRDEAGGRVWLCDAGLVGGEVLGGYRVGWLRWGIRLLLLRRGSLCRLRSRSTCFLVFLRRSSFALVHLLIVGLSQ